MSTFKGKTIEVKLTFTEGILGTSPNDKDIYRNFIGSKSPDAMSVEEEVECVGADAVIEKGMTVFPRDEDGNPFIYDYQIKGFFKDTCKALSKVPGTESSKIKAFKQEIDTLIFPKPRQIIFENVQMGVCQRPLRASTALGERIALAMSEEIAAGATITFEINALTDSVTKKTTGSSYDLMAAIREWLDYGQLRGIGQWRNSGKGRFDWEEIRCY